MATRHKPARLRHNPPVNTHLRPAAEQWGLTERQTAILRVLVQRYLADGAPVASHEVTANAPIQMSSATVRSEFAVLAERGYLAQPHAAAGRVPTDEALRLYARELIGQPALSPAGQHRVDHALNAIRHELELLLEQTSRLLHEETGCVGIVAAPREQWGHLETLRLVPVEPRRLLIALVFAWGHVESIIITGLPAEASLADLAPLERHLQQELAGQHLRDLDAGRRERIFGAASQRSRGARAVCEPLERFIAVLADSVAARVVSHGVLNVAADPVFDDQQRLRTLLRLVEDPGFLADIFLDMAPARPGVRIRIGRDLGGAEYDGLALVWAPFGRRDGQGGKTGIFGPARLPYATALPLVEYCANWLDRHLPSPSRLIN